MIGQTQRCQMLKNIYFLVSYDAMLDSIYKKNKGHNILKNENIFKISLK